MNCDDFETLLVGQLVLRAENMALLASIEAVARVGGGIVVDGLPLLDWYKQQRKAEFEKVLFSLEDSMPGMAAALQARIDAARAQL